MCGLSSPPATYQHVIWIWFENHSYGSIVGSPQAPYINSLGTKCVLFTNFYTETHPSLPDYIAATSGSTQGLARDCAPNGCPITAPSLFHEVEVAGKTWKGYAESMPRNCAPYDTKPYAVRHNPPPYYSDIKATCPTRDVPLGTPTSGALATDLANSTLPSFAFIAPNLCSDMHDCSVATGDAWLKSWLNAIVASQTYRNGKTAVFVTWDEGTGGTHGQDCFTTQDESCHVATYLVASAAPRGLHYAGRLSHYSMLYATENMLGLPHLRPATAGPDLRKGARL
ncbi:MAG: phosphatidylinositol-3-phosphatase [Frankiales bacterium]|jgi:hypothetical protein|nr:phosphatidylinositol-3-phosphatase [Frankiales bacterium]